MVKVPWIDVESGKLTVHAIDTRDSRYDLRDPRVVQERGKSTWSYLTSISYLRIARSKDGRHFDIDDGAFLYPSGNLEIFGVEDPRITAIDGAYYITYSAISPAGVGVGLAVTRDFRSVERMGMIFPPENKDVVLFPERVGGTYYALHRPVPKGVGGPEIWIAESQDLRHWGNHRHLLPLRPGQWDSTRIGAGAPPIKTPSGWLELYHGADERNRYCMGAILLDLNDPTKLLARAEQPILVPEADYERVGFFGDVVFSCGALVSRDIVKLYYGVSDTSMACAELRLSEILGALTYL